MQKTPKQINGLLGLLRYYRKFSDDFAKWTKPMSKFLKKGEQIKINNSEYANCFNTCRNPIY